MIRVIKKLLSSEIIRYGFVAILNTTFSYSVYSLLIFLDFRYQIASLASIVLGILFSFLTQGTLVFMAFSFAAFTRFIAVWSGLYLLNIWLIGQIQKFSLNLYFAGALANLPIALLGYFLVKHFVFSLIKRERTGR